jgi:SARP family transcriptional regulator, regulator of embCAB operon
MRASTCQVPHLDDQDHALPDDRSTLHFGVLGPLTVGDAEAGDVVAIAPKMRTVLALLVSHADQVVPTSVLIRELWDDSPPASGLRTLQTYILNCRKLLRRLTGLPAAELSGQVLVTQAGGYGFRSHGSPVDWMEYQRLTDRGTRAVAEGDDTRGIRLLDEALALWRGSALGEQGYPSQLALWTSNGSLIEELALDSLDLPLHRLESQPGHAAAWPINMYLCHHGHCAHSVLFGPDRPCRWHHLQREA